MPMNVRSSIAAGTAKAQNAAFFSTALSPIGADVTPTKFRITISLSAAVVVQVTLDNATTWSALFEGNVLQASCTYGFDVPLRGGDLFNMRIPTSGGATIQICRIDEVINEG